MQCFASFIDNSIQAFDYYNYLVRQGKIENAQNTFFLKIDISLKGTQQSNFDDLLVVDLDDIDDELCNQSYIEIKDNGVGISPLALKETLTTFGMINNYQYKSDYNMSEHGINLKLSSLRLASTCLIISKTKPTFSFGSST